MPDGVAGISGRAHNKAEGGNEANPGFKKPPRGGAGGNATGGKEEEEVYRGFAPPRLELGARIKTLRRRLHVASQEQLRRESGAHSTIRHGHGTCYVAQLGAFAPGAAFTHSDKWR